MAKLTTWLQLWKRIGKQPLSKTMHNYVKCYTNGKFWYCELEYKDNGSDFYLVPSILAKEENNES